MDHQSPYSAEHILPAIHLVARRSDLSWEGSVITIFGALTARYQGFSKFCHGLKIAKATFFTVQRQAKAAWSKGESVRVSILESSI